MPGRNKNRMNNIKEIYGVRIPPPVDDKIGASESIVDTILLAIWLILAFAWGAIWFAIWAVIAIPIFVAIMFICYLFEFLSSPFRRNAFK